MRLPEGEPEAGGWRAVPLAHLVLQLLDAAVHAAGGDPAPDRPLVIAVDGRSSSGKTTLTRRLAEHLREHDPARGPVAVVHTDDIAWHQAAFDWDRLLVDGVLRPAREGRPVAYRPPAWEARGRDGAIEVPDGVRTLLVEGDGAARRALRPWLDAAVYVQSDLVEIDRRNADRLAAGEMTPEDFRSWMDEEHRFVLDDRPWERADAVVTGSPEIPCDPVREVVISWPPPPLRAPRPRPAPPGRP